MRERYALRFQRTPPTWISAFQLPSEAPIIEAIRETESSIAELKNQLVLANLRLDQASTFQKLLFEQGEDVLEPMVRDALRELGANVDEPKRRGREDGRLTDPLGRKGMLEIKGRTGNLRLSDVRELDNWVRDALADEEWDSKGILIVNLQCEEDPRNRKEFIPPNCATAAARFDISIFTTSQLFQALVADQQGNLDGKKFWDSLFDSKGLCDLPDLVQSKSAASQGS